MQLTHGECFAGIGGFAQGAKYSRIETIWSIEINEYCKKVIELRHGHTTASDITKIENMPRCGIISGGFPCQNISSNGRMEGIGGQQSRLWEYMFKLCSQIRPRYIIIENSPNLTFLGLSSILAQLASIGYDAEWQCLSNAEFGYPHHRKRIYLIAYLTEGRVSELVSVGSEITSIFRKFTSNENFGYTHAQRILQSADVRILRNDDRIPSRVQQIAALGNTVNPTITHYLFECIKKHNQEYYN